MPYNHYLDLLKRGLISLGEFKKTLGDALRREVPLYTLGEATRGYRDPREFEFIQIAIDDERGRH